MNVLLKAFAVLCAASLTALLLRKNAPEMSLLLSLAAVTAVLCAGAVYASELKTLTKTLERLTQDDGKLSAPLLKCAAVGIVTRLGAGLCRDASQGGAAAALELLGTVCALTVAAPLLIGVLDSIGTFF